jgi:hypothetical protein
MTPEYASREQALANFAAAFLRGAQLRMAMTPREAAEAAWYAGHPYGSVDAIEQAITARRQRHAASLATRDAEKASSSRRAIRAAA